MANNLAQSIVLITSSDPEILNFGTGFIIYRNAQAAYILTCWHVIRDVGGIDAVQIGKYQARVIASSSDDSADDMTVLCVEGFLDREPLPLCQCGAQGETFATIGYSLYDKRHKRFRLEQLQGALEKEVWLKSREQDDRTHAWVLQMDETSRLQRGHSGSPVLDRKSAMVLGMASYKEGQGEGGIAISIETLQKIWPDMPFAFRQSSETPVKAVEKPARIAPNPFGDRGCIVDPKRFFDREDILRRILETLKKGSSAALIGEFRIGKSSLLAMVQRLGPKALRLPSETFLNLDMQPIRNEDEFFEALCDDIGIPTCRGFKLTRALRGKTYILCIDEIEKMNKKEHFSRDIREELRGLAGSPNAPFRLLIASRSPLERLFPDSPDMTSPLANICVKIDVKPFSPTIARDFLLHRLRHSGISFTEAHISDLIDRTGGHPGKLQDEAAQLYAELARNMQKR